MNYLLNFVMKYIFAKCKTVQLFATILSQKYPASHLNTKKRRRFFYTVSKHRHVSELKMCTHLTIKVALAPRSIHPSYVHQKSPIKGWHCPFYPNTLYIDDTVTLWPPYYFETPVFNALFVDPFVRALYLLNRQIVL